MGDVIKIFIAVVIGGCFRITFKVELAKTKKILSYQSIEINRTSAKMKKISNDISSFKDEIKSFNDRFQLLMDFSFLLRTGDHNDLQQIFGMEPIR
ncbi:MAG: hypothetical protein LBH43_03705 [Treponema sp.]|jgi:chromosome segregation ATPase|nr:hypothetical protein [Treponema sp.]